MFLDWFGLLLLLTNVCLITDWISATSGYVGSIISCVVLRTVRISIIHIRSLSCCTPDRRSQAPLLIVRAW